MTSAESGTGNAWPDLNLADWADARVTLHRWTQVVGKVRLVLEPMVNHWRQVLLEVSARAATKVVRWDRAALEVRS